MPNESVPARKKIFIICPVRGVTPVVRAQIVYYIKVLEEQGNEVYWPEFHTDQDDPIGLAICLQNRKAINEADEVHVWYDEKSQGSIFDFGMTFAFMLTQHQKRIIIANHWAVRPTEGKSFQNVLRAMDGKTGDDLRALAKGENSCQDGEHPKIWSDRSILRSIPNPSASGYEINHKNPELTFLGVEGQPDFATIYITCYPNKKIVELKSLKQYFYQFRTKVISYERLANVVYDDLMSVYEPARLRLVMVTAPRGGISSRLVIDSDWAVRGGGEIFRDWLRTSDEC